MEKQINQHEILAGDTVISFLSLLYGNKYNAQWKASVLIFFNQHVLLFSGSDTV